MEAALVANLNMHVEKISNTTLPSPKPSDFSLYFLYTSQPNRPLASFNGTYKSLRLKFYRIPAF
jgi:hypothetical protein